MYPHVHQFETRSQQHDLERQLIRERKQARAGKTVNHPSLLTKISSVIGRARPAKSHRAIPAVAPTPSDRHLP
jgi:hypothetical protein